jgi:hypothetical protein
MYDSKFFQLHSTKAMLHFHLPQSLRFAPLSVIVAVSLTGMPMAATAATSGEEALAIGVLVLWLLAMVGYFIPTIIALLRGRDNKWQVLALNLLLGWSVIGWIVAFVWSLGGSRSQQVVVQVQNGGPHATRN